MSHKHNWGPAPAAASGETTRLSSEECLLPETRTLTVSVYRRPDGEPTCCRDRGAKEDCPWLRAYRRGSKFACHLTGRRLADSTGDGSGWLLPGEHCPLWSESEDR